MDRHIKFCNLTGTFDATDRSVIRSEFGKFGRIRKIYLTDTFTKVYFENQGCCERAVQGLRDNEFGWIIELKKEGIHHKSENQSNSTFKPESTMEDYLDQDFVENNEYCDIHGNPLTTFQGEYTNDLFVKLSDIRRAGFAVFRRDNFDRLIANKNQIFKEFELHLLSEAKNYILKNRVAEIDEEQILKTIERCKTKLLGNSIDHSVGRKVTSSSSKNMTIVSPMSQNVPIGGYESFDSSEPVVSQRPPKVLPNNFVPSERTNRQRTFQDHRDNGRDTNGFSSDRDHSSNQDRSNKSGYRNRSREESISSNNSGRRGFNSRDRNPNSDTTQWSKPRDVGSHFDRRQGRDNSDRSDKPSESADRKPRMEFEVNEQLEKIAFQDGASYEVQVCYLEREHGKNNICWVHKNDLASDLEDVILKLLDAGPECEMITDPRTGQICVAPYEDAWYRCKIIKKEPLYVQFLDYGNKSQVDCVKVLPEEFRQIPALATRMVFSKEESIVLEDEMDLTVKIKHKYEDGTHVVENDKQPPKPSKQQNAERITPHVEKPTVAKVEEPTAAPAEESTGKSEEVKLEEKQYFDVPEPLCTLKNGDMIMICGMLDNRFTVKTRECATKTKELLEYIKSLDKSALPLPSGVSEGQLVLCPIDGLPNLCRAVVAEKPAAGTAAVRYLDYNGGDLLSAKSLRNVDAHLAAHPACLLLTPPHAALGRLTGEAEAVVAQLVENKAKGQLILNENDFDIQMDDGSYLLRDICNPSSESKTETVPAKAEQAKLVPKAEPVKTPTKKDEPPVTYDDMDWIKAEVGTTEQFICYTIKDLENVTLLSLTDESLKYLEAVTDMVVEDDTPYEPDLFEMCMVSYKALEDPEASWYRGAVLEKDGDKITVNSVDYGTNIIVTKKDIRKFDKKYQDIPILGITCELVDVPNNEKVLEKLKEMIPEGEQLTVVLKDFDGLKYKIEIPEVHGKLKKLGLI